VNPFVHPAARRDILDQTRYYGELGRNDLAMRSLDSVRLSIEMLARAPDAGTPKIFGNPKLTGLRPWPVAGFEPFKVYYLVDAHHITVVRILHGRRDIDRILDAGNETDDFT